MKLRKNHRPGRLLLQEKAKAYEQMIYERLGTAASYVSRKYIYMEVSRELGVSERTAQDILNEE